MMIITSICQEVMRIILNRFHIVHFVVENLNLKIYRDTAIVTDDEAINTSKRLIREEGILCGISSGTNVVAALRLAKKLGKGKTVVTVLPDTGERYFSTELFE